MIQLPGNKEVKNILIGGQNGSPKQISEIYIGGPGNIPYLVWKHAEAAEGEIITIVETGIFTVPVGVKRLDVFLVGGGAGGNGCLRFNDDSYRFYCGGGGGGGYTSTILNMNVNQGQEITAVIGEGGAAGTAVNGTTVSSLLFGTSGSMSMFGNYTADGGKTAKDDGSTDINAVWYGGSGGSGGGFGGRKPTAEGSTVAAGEKGTDGANGFFTETTVATNGYGIGQGTTTRSFAEESGTLYANGGDGGKVNIGTVGDGASGISNTGDGGSGGGYFWGSNKSGGSGGSGIILVRCHI